MKVFTPSEEESTPASSLGWAGGVAWYRDADAPAGSREPTAEELAAANLELPAIRSLKASTRRKIEHEVGDLHEIVADQAKQIEALTVMLCRLSAEYLGGTAMSDADKTKYLTRVEMVLGAIDQGQLVLRGDLEGTDDMLQKTLMRTDRVNRIVGEEYLPRLRDFLDLGNDK